MCRGRPNPNSGGPWSWGTHSSQGKPSCSAHVLLLARNPSIGSEPALGTLATLGLSGNLLSSFNPAYHSHNAVMLWGQRAWVLLEVSPLQAGLSGNSLQA